MTVIHWFLKQIDHSHLIGDNFELSKREKKISAKILDQISEHLEDEILSAKKRINGEAYKLLRRNQVTNERKAVIFVDKIVAAERSLLACERSYNSFEAIANSGTSLQAVDLEAFSGEYFYP